MRVCIVAGAFWPPNRRNALRLCKSLHTRFPSLGSSALRLNPEVAHRLQKVRDSLEFPLEFFFRLLISVLEDLIRPSRDHEPRSIDG